MLEPIEPIHVVADLEGEGPNGEKFAVFAVYPSRRAEGGGCVGVIVSLHHDRKAAVAIVRNCSPAMETLQ